MKVSVRTSTRVDFAGGTLDLYPLYLFMDGGITVNAGVNLNCYVDIETRKDRQIQIHSIDLDEKVLFNGIDDMTMEGSSAFIERAIKSYRPKTGINITTRSTAPRGSGLGASSSLMMALSAALLKVNGEEIDVIPMIDRGAAIEATHLGIPTGKQDYYTAVLGGVLALHFDEKGCLAEKIDLSPIFMEELNRCMIVSFTGISHFSGTNNWDMLKRAIEKVGETFDNLLVIKKIAEEVRQALIEENLEELGFLIGNEWESRKLLAPGISNRTINEAIENAKQAGAWGSKLCGAGGGGCMITLTPPECKKDVETVLVNCGIELLDAGLDFDGLSVEVEE